MSSFGGDGGYRPGVGDMPGGWYAALPRVNINASVNLCLACTNVSLFLLCVCVALFNQGPWFCS